jgi:hypothetical protein
MYGKKMTPARKKTMEKIVKGMKKSAKDFAKRYGKKNAEGVIYGAATNIAKKRKK